MNILIACDSFKGTLSSDEVCRIISCELKKAIPELNITECPLADGGEGTTEVINSALSGTITNVSVHDPFMRKITASYALCGDTAVMEMSKASGITLLSKNELSPLYTSSYGTGELINDALSKDVKNIIIGIGGSATNDGGKGMLKALGVKFTDKYDNSLPEGGKSLGKLKNIDISAMDSRIKNVNIRVACDVTSPLCGENGATKVFAPQKGANMNDIEVLEAAMQNYSFVCKELFGTDYSDLAGAGAAGGVGFALTAFCKAKLESGFSIISDILNLEEKIVNSDIIITGEGKTDRSSLLGKLPVSVAALSKKCGKKCILISGDIDCDSEPLNELFCCYQKARQESDTTEKAMANAKARLSGAALSVTPYIKYLMEKNI